VNGLKLIDLVQEEAGRKARGEPPLQLPKPELPHRLGSTHRTGQAGRLFVGWLLSMLGGGAILLYWLFWVNAHAGIYLALGGTAVGIVGFIWQCVAVRCPRCGIAVVWHTFKTMSPNAANAAIWKQAVCPKCGYDPP
jgi:ribosomal protein S27AE